jgi:DNA-directed RNA polymerase specialized sigma24 family protein
MNPPPPVLSAEDECQAATTLLAADTKNSAEERLCALERLRPVIQSVARRVSFRFGGQGGSDIIDDAYTEIWARITLFTPDKKFKAWCYTVLRNLWLDGDRRDTTQRRRVLRAAADQPEQEDLRAAVERALDARELFSAEDVQRITAWPTRLRLVLLCLSGLWRKVPTSDWESWVVEHRTLHRSPESVPFPSATLDAADAVAVRRRLLAVELHLQPNTITAQVCRGRDRLRELAYVRERIGPNANV